MKKKIKKLKVSKQRPKHYQPPLKFNASFEEAFKTLIQDKKKE